MNRYNLVTILFLFLASFVSAENFSALAPEGIKIGNVSEIAGGYKVTGVSKNNNTISAFMESITNSGAGTPDLKMVILNPNGPGKYFEMVVLRESKVIPTQSNNNKEKLLDKKYNVRVIIKEDSFEINGSRYFNQLAIRNTYMNNKDMRIVICVEKDAPKNALRELLTTFSQLNTLGMEVLPGTNCN